MNVLYLCHRLPYPPQRGGKIRPFNMIRHLSRRHDVYVVSLARSRAELEEGAGLAAFSRGQCVEIVGKAAAWLRSFANLPTSAPSSFGYFRSPRLRKRVRAWLDARRFDLIFVHCSSVAPYVAHVRDVPKVIDFGDMDSQKWLAYGATRRWPLSWGYTLEGVKLERRERALAARFDLATCTTKAELDTLESYATARATGWFPNGVDHRYFMPAAAPYDEEEICFVGRMDYFPNQQAVLWFANEVLPRLRSRRPGVRLTVVGASPPAKIARLGARSGITVTGSVPDVRPYVTRCALSVAPLKIARGTQNKILESMAMGVPVVASDAACGGIDAEPGEHLLAATSAAEFVEAVDAVLGDPALRARLSAAGRERVLSHHDWARSMSRLDALLGACL